MVAHAALVDDRHAVTAAGVDVAGGEAAFVQLGGDLVPILPELSAPIGDFLRLVPLERSANATDAPKTVCLPESDEAHSIREVPPDLGHRY